MLLSWSAGKYDAGVTAVDNNAGSNAQMFSFLSKQSK